MTTLYTFVTGADGAGKTTFLQALGDPAEFWEDGGVEYRHLMVDDSLEVYLFCATDSSRFDMLLELSERDLLGYIVLVDSTDKNTWAEAQALLANCRGYALLPTIIAANKQDISGAAKPEQVAGWIGMEQMMSAVGCVAVDPFSARDVFLQLLYSVNREIERLDELIKQLEALSADGSSAS